MIQLPRQIDLSRRPASQKSISTYQLHLKPLVTRFSRPHVPCRKLQLNRRTRIQAVDEPSKTGETSGSLGRELLGSSWSNSARLSDDMLQSLIELPGTKGMYDFRTRADSLSSWKLSLQKGTLPKVKELEWPQEPFKSKFADALQNLEMPRFTRRYPAVLNTLMRQMLTLTQEFEQKLAQAEQQQQQQQDQQQQQQSQQSPQQQQQQQQQPENQDQQESGESDQTEQSGSSNSESGEQDQQDQQGQEMSQEQMEQAMQDALNQQKQSPNQNQSQPGQQQLNVQLEGMEGEAGQNDQDSKNNGDIREQLERMADDIVQGFEQQMAQVMENLDRGEQALDDLNTLLEGNEGFDLTRGTWRRSGWRELDSLRKVLENCSELRDLVRQLGRGGGKGPLRRAPEEVEARGYPPGVIRSPLQPEEVHGLTRSDELSRMLPSEMAMMAHGWPRKTTSLDTRDDGSSEETMEEYYLPGAHAARMLHRVRRAERMLLSYERTGWLDDEPARVTGRTEIRPAAELGPIILCLDTSGSMRGARETVAKALALECLRGAHRQQRPCFLYAFSGPNEVQQLDLRISTDSLDHLLEFLSCSFSGGTDVDAPLKLSLDKLRQQEWEQADILMVTDGEIPAPTDSVKEAISVMHSELGLEVHGLMVSSQVTDAMRELCTDLHVFKSWTAVGGQDYLY